MEQRERTEARERDACCAVHDEHTIVHSLPAGVTTTTTTLGSDVPKSAANFVAHLARALAAAAQPQLLPAVSCQRCARRW